MTQLAPVRAGAIDRMHRHGAREQILAAHNRALPKTARSWLVNESTVCFFVGNDTGPNSPQEASAEARFGAAGIGWQLRAVQSNFTGLERWELAASRNPAVRVLVSRNTDCAGENWDMVRGAMRDHPEYWLRTADGRVYTVPW
eukprot:gene37749-18597_t